MTFTEFKNYANIGLLTTFTLGGSIAGTFSLIAYSAGIMAHGSTVVGVILGIGAAFVVPFVGGGLWGIGLKSILKQDVPGVFKATGFRWAISVFLGDLLLLGVNQLSGLFANKFGGLSADISVIFLISFSVVAGLLAGINSHWVLKRFGHPTASRKGGLYSGVLGMLAFVVIVLLMKNLGWEIGGAGYKQYKMSIVATLSAVGATMAGGTVLGYFLYRAD